MARLRGNESSLQGHVGKRGRGGEGGREERRKDNVRGHFSMGV